MTRFKLAALTLIALLVVVCTAAGQLTVVAAEAEATTPTCSYDPGHEFCDPEAPAHTRNLPVQVGQVHLTELALRHEEGAWYADVTVSTQDHPGLVRVVSYRWAAEDEESWIATPGSSGTFVARDIFVGTGKVPFGLAVEWKDVNGQLWSRGSTLHVGVAPDGTRDATAPGQYSFYAQAGSRIQVR